VPALLVIMIVLIVVVGPKDLPKMMLAVGKATARMRMTAQEFRNQFDEAMREAEMKDLADTFSDAKKLDPGHSLKQIFDPIRSAAQDISEKVRDATVADSAPARHEKPAADDRYAQSAPGVTEADTPAQQVSDSNMAQTGKEGAEA